jgi:uncharacterized protein YbjT (DUF2867 family)
MATILVTGGTGTLGREVVPRLLVRRHQVRVLIHQASDSALAGVEAMPGDLVTGAGLDSALAGAEVVLHLASGSQQALATDVGGTRNLLAAARTAAASSGATPAHIIYSSIVGVDRSNMPYYVAKDAAEALIVASGLPWSILRATQFHGFIASILRSLGLVTQPQVAVPAGVRVQSIDVGEVAERLVALAELGPLGHVAQMGGPEVLDLEAMAAAYLCVRGRGQTEQLRAEPLRSPMFDAWRSGTNLAPEHAFGVITWEQYLAGVPTPVI